MFEKFLDFIPKAEEAESRGDIFRLEQIVEDSLQQKGLSDDDTSILEGLLTDLNEIKKRKFGVELEVTMSFSKGITEGFRSKKIKWSNLHKLSNSKWNYSPSCFKNGYRDLDHWLDGNDCVVLDVDDGMTVFECTEIIQANGWKALITTTKSHQINKGGKVCDRFRVFLPTVDKFRGTTKDFSNSMEKIFRVFNNNVDRATKDASRFYYGNEKGKKYYVDGNELLQWKNFKPSHIKIAKRKSRKEWYEKKENNEKIENWFKENIGVGQRNNMLFRAYKFYQNEGLSKNEIYQKVRDINNSCSDPLEELEVKRICRIN